MALVFSLREGQGFFVDGHHVVVTKIKGPGLFLVRANGFNFAVSRERAVEVMENVFLSSGDRGNYSTAQVNIDAPREMKILREEAYRECK